MKPIFKDWRTNVIVVYQLAEQARAKGLDPRLTVEIPRASDLADRTQKLLDFLHPRRTAEPNP